jgi:succinate dehydrogenase / fumarate reductase membrane anchor subunit
MLSKIKEFLHPLSAQLMALSAKNQWLWQRVTAFLLVPLVIWLGFFFHVALTASYSAFSEWLLGPWNLACLFVFLGVVASHGYLGLKVIIEDYLSDQQFQEQLILTALWGFGLLGVSAVGVVIILFFRV